ncbi:hypothetical protein AOLI_G00194880, partial [Acnodon oligacanthus]
DYHVALGAPYKRNAVVEQSAGAAVVVSCRSCARFVPLSAGGSTHRRSHRHSADKHTDGRMASSMSGMFPGQQPPAHPAPVPGAAAPLSAPSGSRAPGVGGAGGSSTLVDDLEASFEACFASLVSQDYVNGTDQEEIRTGVDQCIQKFLDVARQIECFFLQKRLQLSVQKPEQVEKEDISELRNELQRKEMLIQKHLTKIHHWQQVLEDINVQHKKPTELPQGPLAFLEQASANLPAPIKPN